MVDILLRGTLHASNAIIPKLVFQCHVATAKLGLLITNSYQIESAVQTLSQGYDIGVVESSSNMSYLASCFGKLAS